MRRSECSECVCSSICLSRCRPAEYRKDARVGACGHANTRVDRAIGAGVDLQVVLACVVVEGLLDVALRTCNSHFADVVKVEGRLWGFAHHRRF